VLVIAVAGYRKLRDTVREAALQNPSDLGGSVVRANGYLGAPNLETMEVARNYNTFLTSAVLSRADRARPVLDFGAGNGTHARALRTRGLDVRCVEPDPRLRRQLKAEGFEAAGSVTEYCREIFGSVYSLNVLEHIEDDAAALRDLFSATEPGGRLIAYVPAFPVLFSAMDREVGHFRRYRKRGLTALVTDAGFRVTGCRYVDSLGFPAALAYRCVSRTGRLNPRSVARYDRVVFPLSRAVDRMAARWIGKNLLLEARRD
jgi:SAM-dependent methyltransferase